MSRLWKLAQAPQAGVWETQQVSSCAYTRLQLQAGPVTVPGAGAQLATQENEAHVSSLLPGPAKARHIMHD